MLKKFRDWLSERFSDTEDTLPQPLERTGSYAPQKPKRLPSQKSVETLASKDRNLKSRVENAGPGKTVLIRNKYVREETGTHETLKILDDSLVDSGEETGIDPYNTGGFDRSKNWSNRFRK
jgi:hypothetical protein